MRSHPTRHVLSAACLALLLALGAGCGAGSPQRAAAVAAATADAAPAMSAEKLARIDRAWQDYVDKGRLAGAVLLVQQDGKPAFSRAWGLRDREARDPMREDTLFRIASQTKALVSVGVMMLVEDGKLALDDPLGKHLPEWARTTVGVARDGGGYDTVPARRPITIRDLLSHTSGISYAYGDEEPGNAAWREAGIEGWYFADRDEPMAAIVARMASLPMMAQPGEKFVYGYSTDILGVLVERTSGQPLDAFLGERLLAPLDMRDTHFFLPPEKAARLAAVYAADGSRPVVRAPDVGSEGGSRNTGQGNYVEGPRVALSGGAGLVSTARDYGRFLEMLRLGGEFGGKRYLSRESIAEMTRDQLRGAPYQEDGAGFGLGFEVKTDAARSRQPGPVGTFGWGGAYHSTYWVDPDNRLSVVYLTQLIPAGDLDDQERLRELVYEAIE